MTSLKLAMFLLGIMFFLAIPVFGLDIATREIKFSDDPVKILETSAGLVEQKYGKELYCHMKYVNQSNNAIDALSFRMLFYDVFNEYLDTISGVSIRRFPPGETEYSSWKPNIYKDWSTHTIVVFLDKVRFVDGTVWRRPEDEITLEINKLKYILFRPEQLKEKRKE